jgi:DNA ligase-associated metallophosphoesterase
VAGRGVAEIEIRGRRLILDPSGALIFPDHDLLVVADLHFEKGSAFARRGQFLPPYDTRSTLDELERLLSRIRPRRVVSLGDGFHDDAGCERLDRRDAARLQILIDAHEWTWVTGNHDPNPPRGVGGGSATDIVIDGLCLRHTPASERTDGEIAGHLHPAARLHRRGRSIRCACFVSDGQRMVLPAFGAFTGGLDIQNDAFRRLFVMQPTAWLLGRRAVHRVPSDRLDG